MEILTGFLIMLGFAVLMALSGLGNGIAHQTEDTPEETAPVTVVESQNSENSDVGQP